MACPIADYTCASDSELDFEVGGAQFCQNWSIVLREYAQDLNISVYTDETCRNCGLHATDGLGAS